MKKKTLLPCVIESFVIFTLFLNNKMSQFFNEFILKISNQVHLVNKVKKGVDNAYLIPKI